MRMEEHLQLLNGKNYQPRVIERQNCDKDWIYYAWTSVWEGPARPEYQAAVADLNEYIRDTDYRFRCGRLLKSRR